MVSLNNTKWAYNVIQNKQFMYNTYYYMDVKGAKGLVTSAVTRTGHSNNCVILTKHLG